MYTLNLYLVSFRTLLALLGGAGAREIYTYTAMYGWLFELLSVDLAACSVFGREHSDASVKQFTGRWQCLRPR